YQYTLEDPDAQELDEWAGKFVAKLRALPKLRDVASDLQNRGLQKRLTIDRRTAARFGITPQLIDDTLYDAFGQRQIAIIFTQLNQYRVVLEALPQFQSNPEMLRNIYVRAPLAGGAVPSTAPGAAAPSTATGGAAASTVAGVGVSSGAVAG